MQSTDQSTTAETPQQQTGLVHLDPLPIKNVPLVSTTPDPIEAASNIEMSTETINDGCAARVSTSAGLNVGA